MSLEERDKYWRSISVVEAKDTLRLIEIALIPHLDDKDRSKRIDKYQKQSSLVKRKTGNTLSNKELFELMKKR